MSEQIKQLELSIEEAKEMIALGDAIEKLYKNTYFKKVILEGYFKDEAIRLVMAKSNPMLLQGNAVMKSDDIQRDLDRGIFGIGFLQQYLFTRLKFAEQAKKALSDSELMLEELRLNPEEE